MRRPAWRLFTFERPSGASIEALVALVAADMERVNATILNRGPAPK